MKCRLFTLLLLGALVASCQDDVSDDLRRAAVADDSDSPLKRAVADSMSVSDFRRCYGVGFSYDGVGGNWCNVHDVKCKVLNLDAIRNWENEDSDRGRLFYSFAQNTYDIEISRSFSESQYTQTTTFGAWGSASLVVLNVDLSGLLSLKSEVVSNDMFMKISYVPPSLSMMLDEVSLPYIVTEGKHTEFLTPNFLESVEWLATHTDDKTLDEFVNIYGTHIITEAKVGGAITLQLHMQTDNRMDISGKDILGKAAVKKILTAEYTSKDQDAALQQLSKADCSVTISGGDLSTIPNEVLRFSMKEPPDLSAYVDNWEASLNFDGYDPTACNLEMIDMRLGIPIWELIPDEAVARRVMLHIVSDAAELINANGHRNLINAAFLLPEDVTCNMGPKSTTFSHVGVANIIAAGHYVATVCRETIEFPSKEQAEVQVVYPIYDGEVNLRCGYCTHGGYAYSVMWNASSCVVDTIGEANTDGMVYMTLGVPSPARYDKVNYQTCKTVIGYEWPASIKKDGSLNASAPYYLVSKSGQQFLLLNADGSEQSGRLDALPNWDYDETTNRMVRSDDYRYYWNPTEVN